MFVNLHDFIYFSGALTALLICVIVTLYPGRQPTSNRFLACAFFSLGYMLFGFFLLGTGLIYRLPHLYRTAGLSSFLFWPSMYLYIRLSVRPSPLRWPDGLHLLPTVLFLVDFIPFFLLSAEAKSQILATKTYSGLILDLREGWLFSPGFYTVVRLGQIALYWLLQLHLFRRWYLENRHSEADWAQTWLRWFALLMGMQFILVISAGLLVMGRPESSFHTWLTSCIGLMSLLMSLLLLLRPQILYGLQPTATSSSTTPPPTAETPVRPVRAPEPRPFHDEIHQRLTRLMEEEKPYLQVGYTLPDLAADASVPVHQLSGYINSHYGVNFNEYINQFRIEYFKRQLERHDWNHKTLEALAMESGFSNRFTFTNAFKRLTGTTPSDYVRTLRNAS